MTNTTHPDTVRDQATCGRLFGLAKERLDDLLSYDPDTGIFTWKVTRGPALAGARAGFVSPRGYVFISVDGTLYRAHRLVFLAMTGSFPKYGVDHINGEKSDNRWSNLRDVPHRINVQNKHRSKAGRKYSHLPLGVLIDRRNSVKPYRAKIEIDGKRIHLGPFSNPDEAHEAYLQAKRTYHEGCTI